MNIDWEAVNRGMEPVEDMSTEEKFLGEYSEGEADIETLFNELFSSRGIDELFFPKGMTKDISKQ